MADDGVVLALDLGTSSVRALVTDDRGRALPGIEARRPTRLRVDDSGRAELDPGEMTDAVVDCIDELHTAGHLDAVARVATSCLWHAVMGLDEAGDPVTPLFTWADARASVLVPELRERADTGALHQRTGSHLHALYWTAKIPWLIHERGTRPARFAGLAEHLTARLLDDGSTSLSMASGTGLLDLVACDWDAAALEIAGVEPGQLPPIAGSDWRGKLTADLGRRWPALAGAVWTVPLGDGAAANLGAGCHSPDRAAVTIGTSAAIRVVGGAPDAPLDRRLWRYRVDAERVVTGLALSGGGNLFAWARDTLALPDDLEKALEAVRPGANGVMALPYHAGARPPLDLPGGSGVVAGLSLASSPVEVLAGLLESVCFGLAEGDDALRAGLGQTPEVVATGGALLASGWWQRTLAAVLGRPLALLEARELSAEGAAVSALGIDAQPARVGTVEADDERVTAARAARERQAGLAGRLGWTTAGR